MERSFCNKKGFTSRKVAKKMLKLYKQKNPDTYKLTDVYFCETCQVWHHTSAPKDVSRKWTRSRKNV